MSIYSKIQSLLTAANATTGESDTTLTDAVQTLVDGYGQGGGSSDLAEVDDVTLIDYDGTVLYSYTKDEFLALTELPPNPSHTDKGLVAQGWNWTLPQAKAYVTANDYLCIGQYYKTNDGKTHIKIEITELAVNYNFCIRLYQTVKNGTIIDWGDGTVITVNTNANTASRNTHTYSQTDVYDVTVYSVDGKYTLGYSGSNGGVSYSDNSSKVTAPCIKAIYLGDDCEKITRTFTTWCNNLTELTISPTTELIGDNTNTYIFQNSVLLKAIVFPPNCVFGARALVTNMPSLRFLSFGYNNDYDNGATGQQTIQGPYNIEMLTMPEVSSDLGYGVMYTALRIKRFVVPGTYTKLYGGYLRDCSIVPKIVIPSTVDTINDYAMTGSLFAELHFKSTTPPTVVNSRGLPNAMGVVYVPYSSDHSILNAYKTATNWSSLANYMQEEPQ